MKTPKSLLVPLTVAPKGKSFSPSDAVRQAASIERRTTEIFNEQHLEIFHSSDRLLRNVLLVQWMAAVLVAAIVSPYAWAGTQGYLHPHLVAALLLGGVSTLFPVYLLTKHTGSVFSRQTAAVCQTLMSCLLIHLMAGRVETHFHFFVSLAIFAIYRDWRVLVTMALLIGLDHLVRGYVWPEAVYGTSVGATWRWAEHVFWVWMEVAFLIFACVRSHREMLQIAAKQARLELQHQIVEDQVAMRTKQLQYSELKMRTLFDIAADSLLVVDEDKKIESVNITGCQLLGYAADTLINMKLDQVLPFGQIPDFKSKNAPAMQRIQTVAQKADKTSFYVDCSIAEIPLTDSRRLYLWSIRDITPIKNTEQELRASESRMRGLVEAIPDLLLRFDRDGVILSCNHGSQSRPFFGRRNIVGRRLSEIFSTNTLLVVNQKVDEANETGNLQSFEFSIDDDEGRRELEVRLVRCAEFEYQTVIRDITDQKSAERERQQMSQQLVSLAHQAGMAEIATGILHNVGNVLNSVNVSASLIREQLQQSRQTRVRDVSDLLQQNLDHLDVFLKEDPKGSRIPGFLEKLSDQLSAERDQTLGEIQHLQDNLNHVKTIIAMQQSVAKSCGLEEPTNLEEVLERAVAMQLNSLEKHGIDILRQYGDLPEVILDRQKLLQIVVNLVKNAKEAMTDDAHTGQRRLTLHLEQRGETVRIEVADTGVGVDPANLQRIFTQGFSTKREGHGFGLHSCALAAKSMGGRIDVTSPGPGLGTTFTVELPLHVARELVGTGGGDHCMAVPHL